MGKTTGGGSGLARVLAPAATRRSGRARALGPRGGARRGGRGSVPERTLRYARPPPPTRPRRAPNSCRAALSGSALRSPGRPRVLRAAATLIGTVAGRGVGGQVSGGGAACWEGSTTEFPVRPWEVTVVEELPIGAALPGAAF